MIQVAHTQTPNFKLQGAHVDIWKSKAPELIAGGPYETGKTITCLRKLNALLAKYPQARGLMVRKTYKSLISTAVVTFEQKIHRGQIGKRGYGVSKYGGVRPDFYEYDNGSILQLGGMDNPDKFLSGEYDFIYVNQAEEVMLDDWEKLVGRATGRAGNAPYTQVMGDCNPGNQYHWIRKRDRLMFIETRHKDNPALWDEKKQRWTKQGTRTMETLDSLTGLRYKRGRLGLWVGSEGQVYEFDPAVHMIHKKDLPAVVNRYRVIDFGYTNPFVCQWWFTDHDGRLYMYREIYMTRRTVKVHSGQINELSAGERYAANIADHDAEDRATLEENGIRTMPADKRIKFGIEKVEERLKVQPDGKPRLYIVHDALVEVDTSLKDSHKPTCTEEEFPGYVFPPDKEGKANDENPVKLDDHGMDGTRYMVVHLDGQNRSGFKTTRYV